MAELHAGQPWGPPSHLLNVYRGSPYWGHTDRLPLSGVDVENEQSCVSTLQYACAACTPAVVLVFDTWVWNRYLSKCFLISWYNVRKFHVRMWRTIGGTPHHSLPRKSLALCGRLQCRTFSSSYFMYWMGKSHGYQQLYGWNCALFPGP